MRCYLITFIKIYVYIFVYIYARAHRDIRVHTCVCVSVFIYVCMYVCLSVCMYTGGSVSLLASVQYVLFFFLRLRLYDYVLRVTICRSLPRSEAKRENSFIHPSVRTHSHPRLRSSCI